MVALNYFCAGWTVEGLLKKMNIEPRLGVVEWEKMKKQRSEARGRKSEVRACPPSVWWGQKSGRDRTQRSEIETFEP